MGPCTWMAVIAHLGHCYWQAPKHGAHHGRPCMSVPLFCTTCMWCCMSFVGIVTSCPPMWHIIIRKPICPWLPRKILHGGRNICSKGNEHWYACWTQHCWCPLVMAVAQVWVPQFSLIPPPFPLLKQWSFGWGYGILMLHLSYPTWKEMYTLLWMLQHDWHSTCLVGRHTFYFTDNIVTYHVIKQGSSSVPALHCLA